LSNNELQTQIAQAEVAQITQIQIIRDKIKKAANGNERLRLNVVYLHYKLHTLSQIADLLCLPYNTAKNYLEEYLESNKSDNLPRGGSDEMLSCEQSTDLESHLQNKTYLKCHEIITYIEQAYNITYTPSGKNNKTSLNSTTNSKLLCLQMKKYCFLIQYIRNIKAKRYMDGLKRAVN
jgi:transposase